MIRIRAAAERPRTRNAWLDSRHSFSFADHFDPAWMGHRALRVLNDDRVAPGAGFPPHSHREMEILTLVLEGTLDHRDSGGAEGVLQPGDVQHMRAGTGIVHEEWNASRSEPLHFVQIWLVPEQRGLAPAYRHRPLARALAPGESRLLASPEGREGSLAVGARADLRLLDLPAGVEREHRLAPGRAAWLQVLAGDVELCGHDLVEGDGAAVEDVPALGLRARTATRALLFELD